jgi:Mg2+-importing ATPase
MDATALLDRLATRTSGLTAAEATERLIERGPNVLAKDQRPGMARLVWRAAINPLVLLLTVLACISFATGDARAGFVMSLMIVLGVGLKLFQEAKADSAAAKLRAMISVKATVIRDGQPLEVPVARLVPGDMVQLTAGDMIPADMRIIAAKDLP